MSTKSTQKKFDRIFWLWISIMIIITFGINIIERILPPRIISLKTASVFENNSEKKLTIEFNRQMKHQSIEENISIEPKIDGQWQWQNRILNFIPSENFSLTQKYTLTLKKGATDEYGTIIPTDFIYEFSAKPLKIVYLGTEGQEKDQFIIANQEGIKEKTFSTQGLSVKKFVIASQQKKIYFLGEKPSIHSTKIPAAYPELFSLNLENGSLQQLTNDIYFINQDLAISSDEKYLALSRIQVSNDQIKLTGLLTWISPTSNIQFTRSFNNQSNNLKNVFSPESKYLLQKNTHLFFELTPLDENKNNTPQNTIVLSSYDETYGFHPYLPQILFTKYDNTDVFSLKNDLILYDNQSGEKNLKMQDRGLFRDTDFSPDGKTIITIFSKQTDILDSPGSFVPLRIFHLYKYDLNQENFELLTNDFDYSDENPKITNDSQIILFQRYKVFKDLVVDPDLRDVSESLGSISQAGGELWTYNLKTKELKQLPIRAKDMAWLNNY